MKFTRAIPSGFRNLLTYSGRASRSEYWYWVLFCIIYFVADEIVFGAAFKGKDAPLKMLREPYFILDLAFAFVVLLASIAVTVRRLHDVNHRGWWLFVYVIPFIGLVVLVLWFCD